MVCGRESSFILLYSSIDLHQSQHIHWMLAASDPGKHTAHIFALHAYRKHTPLCTQDGICNSTPKNKLLLKASGDLIPWRTLKILRTHFWQRDTSNDCKYIHTRHEQNPTACVVLQFRFAVHTYEQPAHRMRCRHWRMIDAPSISLVKTLDALICPFQSIPNCITASSTNSNRSSKATATHCSHSEPAFVGLQSSGISPL